MLSLVLTTFAVAAGVLGDVCTHSSCNIGLIKYYTELNCRPVQETGACCPSRFDCSAVLLNRADDKCHLKGRAYDQGAKLTQEQTENNCIAECRCAKYGPKASFQCVNIECPELFNGPPPPDCVRLYQHDQCCSTGLHCKNETKPAAKDVFKCDHGGKSYVVGEKFYPDEEPCMSCICQQGYDGTLKEPWCTKISCGIELHYGERIKEGCAPIFFGQKHCCPIGWRCPEKTDTVIRSSVVAGKKDAPECSFGSLSLKVSDTLNSEKACVECKCSVPPHVSCVQTGYC